MNTDNHDLSRGMPLMVARLRAHGPRTQGAAMPPPSAGSAMPVWMLLLFVAAYVVADSATGLFPNPRFGVQPLSPHPALAIALVALGGTRAIAAVFAAVVVGWAVAHDAGFTLAAVPAAVAMTLVYWAAARALRRWARWDS